MPKRIQQLTLGIDLAPPVKPVPRSDNTHQEVWGCVGYYCENIKPASQADIRGIFKRIKKLLDDGLTIKQLWLAVNHYELDPRRIEGGATFTKGIHRFFTRENILEWQKKPEYKSPDARLTAMGKLEEGIGRPSTDRFNVKPVEDASEEL